MKSFGLKIKAFSLKYRWESICLIGALTVLFCFFYKVIFHANNSYFELSGDGLQTYFNSIFHLKYDNSFFTVGNMNYPYGENVMFTAAQPFVLFPLDILGLEDYTVGAINLLMLFSVPFSALFIYLVFKEFGHIGIWPVLFSISLAYLSPQIFRMGCHYTLTYQFAIPAFFWLLLKFEKNPSFKISWITSIFVFFLAGIHLYFFAFFALIALFYYLYVLIQKRNAGLIKNILFCSKHFFIQILMPYILLQLIMVLTDNVSDRTNNPWGILEYKSNWNGVFFPYGREQELFFREHFFEPKENPLWEGIAYVGIFGTIIFALILLKVVRDVLNKNPKIIFQFSELRVLNYLIICGIIALLYSFGYPFVFDHEDWLVYLGPLKQMRGIARFSWIFFYIINIAGVIFILTKVKKNYLKQLFLTLALMFVAFDAYQGIRNYQNQLYNRVPDLEDKSNNTRNFSWLNKIDIKNYQALIPFPYFHVGSENLDIVPQGQIKKWIYITSIKTGLPILASSYGRTSLSQTAENIQITLEPNFIPKWVNELPNKKSFIILSDQTVRINENEKLILSKSKLISANNDFYVYELSVDSLKSIYFNSNKLAGKEIDLIKDKTINVNGYLYTGTECDFVMKSFNSEAGQGFENNGMLGFGKKYTLLYEDTIPNAKIDSTYTASVWVSNINKDLYPRITFIIDVFDAQHNFLRTVNYSSIKDNNIKRIEGSWALVEAKFQLLNKNEIVKICFFNQSLNEKDSITFDELLIIPSHQKLYKTMENGSIYKNNRIIHKVADK